MLYWIFLCTHMLVFLEWGLATLNIFNGQFSCSNKKNRATFFFSLPPCNTTYAPCLPPLSTRLSYLLLLHWTPSHLLLRWAFNLLVSDIHDCFFKYIFSCIKWTWLWSLCEGPFTPYGKYGYGPFCPVPEVFRPSPLSLRIRSAPGEKEQYHRKLRRQYRVKSRTIRENRYSSIISDKYIYCVECFILKLYYIPDLFILLFPCFGKEL